MLTHFGPVVCQAARAMGTPQLPANATKAVTQVAQRCFNHNTGTMRSAMESGTIILEKVGERTLTPTVMQPKCAEVVSTTAVTAMLDAIKPQSLLFAKMLSAAKQHFKDNPYQNIWVGIDKAALVHNANTLRSVAPDKKLCAVLKADAYGHGIDLVAPVLAPHVDAFGVTESYEAQALRDNAQTCEIPVLRVRLADIFEISAAIEADLNIEELVGSYNTAKLMSDLVLKHDAQPISVHLSLNSSGMGRDGFASAEVQWADTLSAVRAIADLPGIKVKGICGHMPLSDVPEITALNAEATHFIDRVNCLKAMLPEVTDVHLFASGSTLRFQALPEAVRQTITMNRAGGAFFGHQSYEGEDLSKLRHAMNVCTFVTGIFERPGGSTVGYGSHYTVPNGHGEQHAHVPGGWAIFPREALLAQKAQGGLSRLHVMNEQGGAHLILGNPSMNSVICRATSVDKMHHLASMEPVFLMAGQHQLARGDAIQDANTIGEILRSTGARVSVHLGTAKNAAKMLLDE